MKKTFLLFSIFLSSFCCGLKAQTVFPSTTQYVYIGAAGMNASAAPLTIYTSTDATNGTNFSNAVTVTGTTEKINGVGLNQNDHFLYGISFPNLAATQNVSLYRIGADGVSQTVGTIAAPPVLPGIISLINTTSGVVDGNDNYVFTAYVYKGNPLLTPYLVSNFEVYIGEVPNISQLTSGTAPLTPVYHKVNISDPSLQNAFQAFLDNFVYGSPSNSDGGFEDIAFSPADGNLYSYISYPDGMGGMSGRPVMINMLSWTAFPVGTNINSIPGVEIAGAMFDPTGHFYLIFTNGEYGTVDLTTGVLNPLALSSLPLSGNNLRGDLASNVLIPAPLAVKLTSFNGYTTNTGNLLQWSTAEEKDVNTFVLQCSTDGKNFSPVAYINPKGINSSYQYADKHHDVTTFYRLKIQDNDGKYNYSSVVVIASSAIADQATIFPSTITDNQFYVRCNAKSFTVRAFDLSGRIVAAATYRGNNQIQTVPLPSGSAGLLFVTLTDNTTQETIATQKMEKQ